MNTVSKRYAFWACVMMALAIALGAFGVHGLKKILSDQMLVIFHTGVEYHFYHALGLFAVAWVASKNENIMTNRAGILMLFGIFVFSGSLYVLSITGITWLGAITPIGGSAFILAWIFLALGIRKM